MGVLCQRHMSYVIRTKLQLVNRRPRFETQPGSIMVLMGVLGTGKKPPKAFEEEGYNCSVRSPDSNPTLTILQVHDLSST